MIPFREMQKLINLGVHLKSYRQYSNIRQTGGRIGEIGAAAEEVYFRKKNLELVEKIRKKKVEEIENSKKQMAIHLASKDKSNYHTEQIKKLREAIQTAQNVIDKLNKPPKAT